MYKRKRRAASRSGRRFKRARRTFKRKRFSRRQRVGSTVYSYRRMIANGGQIVGNAVNAPYLGSYSSAQLQLGNVVNVSDFQNLYDQYRINYVVIKFWLKIDPGAQAAASASFPKLYWYRDYDDATVPANLNEIRENQKARVAVMHPNRPITIKFRPNSLALLFSSGVASQYKPTWRQWMDMGTVTSQHYGIKYAIDDLTNTNYKVDIEGTLYFQCRQAR